MRRIFWLVIVLTVGIASAPAGAEMSDDTRGVYVKKAWFCGEMFQGINTLGIREHFPDFKRRFLTIAKSKGADDWEVQVLDIAFDSGVINVIKDDIYPGAGPITVEEQNQGIENTNKVVHVCLGDNWRDYKK